MIEKYAPLLSDKPFSTYIAKYVDATTFSDLKVSMLYISRQYNACLKITIYNDN